MIYWLSAGDEITGVGGNWNAFALENDGPGALDELVTGRPLWDFVQGLPTRRFLSDVFHACRHSDDAFSMPYRCDGNGLDRLINLHVVPEGRGVLRIEHHLLRVRPALGGILPRMFDADRYRQCSICMSCHVGLHWMAPGRLIPRPGAQVTYVICPTCRAAAQAMAAEERDGPRFA